MPKKFGNGILALGICIGMMATIVFVVWFGEPSYQVDNVAHPLIHHQNHSQQGFGPFPPAFITTQDTLANWIMTIFSVVAAGLIWQTLKQTNKTNRAAITAANAATEANHILRNEQRPWLTLERELNGHFSVLPIPDSEHFQHSANYAWKYKIRNHGKTPGFGMRVSTKFVYFKSFFDLTQAADMFIGNEQRRGAAKSDKCVFPSEMLDYGMASGVTKFKNTVDGANQFAMLILLSYRNNDAQLLGTEFRILGFEDLNNIGPCGVKMLEYSNYRSVT